MDLRYYCSGAEPAAVSDSAPICRGKLDAQLLWSVLDEKSWLLSHTAFLVCGPLAFNSVAAEFDFRKFLQVVDFDFLEIFRSLSKLGVAQERIYLFDSSN